jgi:hypothetical protein
MLLPLLLLLLCCTLDKGTCLDQLKLCNFLRLHPALAALHHVAGGRWKTGMPQYETALQELSLVVCSTVQRQIHDLVFRRKLLKTAKAFESGKNANKLDKRMCRIRGYAGFVLTPVGI